MPGELEDAPAPLTVPMVRYECAVCEMTATCVVTPATELAWLDHMANHVDQRAFKAWTWGVIPLF